MVMQEAAMAVAPCLVGDACAHNDHRRRRRLANGRLRAKARTPAASGSSGSGVVPATAKASAACGGSLRRGLLLLHAHRELHTRVGAGVEAGAGALDLLASAVRLGMVSRWYSHCTARCSDRTDEDEHELVQSSYVSHRPSRQRTRWAWRRR